MAGVGDLAVVSSRWTSSTLARGPPIDPGRSGSRERSALSGRRMGDPNRLHGHLAIRRALRGPDSTLAPSAAITSVPGLEAASFRRKGLSLPRDRSGNEGEEER